MTEGEFAGKSIIHIILLKNRYLYFRARMRTHMKVCALRTKKKIKELEENAFNNEEYTWELLQIMEDEESSSSIEVLPHTAEADQDSESDESETYEIVVYTENFEEQETSETPKSAK